MLRMVSRPPTDDELAIAQRFVDQVYDDFLNNVSDSRPLSRAELELIAEGRGWAGIKAQSLGLVDEIGGLEDAIAAAARPSSSSIGFGTNIADGIDFAANSLLTNAFDGKRLIIDVSGDGRQNRDCGGNCIGRLQTSRDNALAQGIAINGLPILTDRPNLDNYFASNVVGGPDSFLVAANDFDAFAQAVKTKIGREIAPPQSVPEPGMLIGLAAVSLLGFGAKKRQKDLT